MSTVGHIGPPPPRCGGLSPRPPCRVGLDRTRLARCGGLSHPPPRVDLGRTPPSRHVGLGCCRLTPPRCVGLGRYYTPPPRHVGLGRTRPPPHRVRTVVVVEAVVVSLSSSIRICAVVRHQVLSIGGRCGGSTYLPLDISVGGQKTKTNHEISWFASLHTGGASVLLLVSSAFVVAVSSLLFLVVVVVSPFTAPFLRLTPASPPHRCVVLWIRPSSSLLLQPLSLYGFPRLLPPPDSLSSETNPPTSLWKGEGQIGLQPRL